MYFNGNDMYMYFCHQDAGQNRSSDTDQGYKRLSGGPRFETKGSRSPVQRRKLQVSSA